MRNISFFTRTFSVWLRLNRSQNSSLGLTQISSFHDRKSVTDNFEAAQFCHQSFIENINTWEKTYWSGSRCVCLCFLRLGHPLCVCQSPFRERLFNHSSKVHMRNEFSIIFVCRDAFSRRLSSFPRRPQTPLLSFWHPFLLISTWIHVPACFSVYIFRPIESAFSNFIPPEEEAKN